MTLTAPELTGIDLLERTREQVVAVELDRHLGIAKEWFLHEHAGRAAATSTA
ncbi:hypothetical protein ACU686_37015 [Yinghuangia aomiensis]